MALFISVAFINIALLLLYTDIYQCNIPVTFVLQVPAARLGKRLRMRQRGGALLAPRRRQQHLLALQRLPQLRDLRAAATQKKSKKNQKKYVEK